MGKGGKAQKKAERKKGEDKEKPRVIMEEKRGATCRVTQAGRRQ